MAILVPGGVEIAGPKCGPTRFGLMSVAEIEDRDDGHWETGFFHEQQSCDTISSLAVDCGDTPPKDTDGGLDYPHSDPFVLVAPHECSAFGQPLDRAFTLAENRLRQGTQRAVENVMWSGLDTAGNGIRQTIGGSAGTLEDLGVAASVTEGLALLEEYAGEITACAPIIHAPRVLGSFLAERNLVGYSGSHLYARATQNRVVLGAGYTRDIPPNFVAPPGTAYIAITGGVKITRGPVFFTPTRGDIAEAIDTKVNDITVFAERMFGISIGCGIAIVQVPLVGLS